MGGILGLIYAAEHGADIINASYGGNTFSQIEQDLIRYISEDLGALVVAASGNENSAEPHYPSDYDYVLSVAASNQLDNKAGFSNFGFKVDLSAPGTNIYTTDVADGYTTVNGTSFSAPIVSGAAALVKAQYPNFTGAQLGEVLRISADPAFLNNVAEEYKDKMGHGRLDAYAALTTQSPSVRLDQSVVEGPSGDIAKPGESIQLYGDFINFLWPVSNVQVSLSTSSEYLQIVEGTISIPSLGMLESVSSQATPFVLQLANNVPFNTEVTLRIDYTASGYQDYQLIQLVLNPSYYNLNANLVATSIIDDGRIGYQDIDAKRGQGFVFSDVNMLFEMGIIAGSSSTKLVSNVRSAAGAYDSDFRSNLDIEKTEPGETADVEIFGSFTDADAPATNRLNLRVDYHAYAWKEEPYTNFIIMQYTIKNISGSYLPGVHFGLYADWDINQDDFKDKADWDEGTSTGYVYTPDVENRWVAGIQVLTGKPNYWAIDNDQSISGNPFGVYDDYTDEEKWQSISSGIGREQAGQTGEGNDVSHAVAAGPYNIPADSSIVIAFALHGESTIEGLLSSAEAASQLYISTFGLPPNKAEVDEIAGLMVYPNPSSGLLYVKLAEAGREEVQLRLLDVIGRTLVSQRYAAAAEQIELEMPAEAGLYYLEVRHGDKRSIRKILRQ